MQIRINQIMDKSKIIDIRSSYEYNKNGIEGSINIPRMLLLKNPGVYLNKYDDFYLICNNGTTSLSCAKILNALGYNCYSIIGGINSIN